MTQADISGVARTSLAGDIASVVPVIGNVVSAGQVAAIQQEKPILDTLHDIGFLSNAAYAEQMSDANFDQALAGVGIVFAGVTKIAKVGDLLAGVGKAVKNLFTESRVLASIGRFASERFAGLLRAGDTIGDDSVWKLLPFERGTKIETEVSKTLPGLQTAKPYPVIDQWDRASRTGTSIKSLDLTAITYQKPERLQARLEGFVDSLVNFKGTNMAGIDSTPIQNRALDLVIPKGTATAQQQAILNHLRNYGAANNVRVNIRQLP